MKKHYTPIRNKIILSAALILLMTVPAVVLAQQNFKLTGPVTTLPLNLNSGAIRLVDPNTSPQLHQTLLNLYHQNKPDTTTKDNQATMIYPDGKTLKIIIGAPVKYAALDHMPILTPDMSRYNMPTLGSSQLDHPSLK